MGNRGSEIRIEENCRIPSGTFISGLKNFSILRIEYRMQRFRNDWELAFGILMNAKVPSMIRFRILDLIKRNVKRPLMIKHRPSEF